MTHKPFYTKPLQHFHRFKASDKQQTSWHTSTPSFYTTSGRRTPPSARLSNSYRHHQSTYLLPLPPAIRHLPDHLFAYRHHHPTTQTTHLHPPHLHNLPQLASASHHHYHHSTSRQIGTHGMATPIVALWNSKAIPDSAPIGFLSLDELDSPSSNVEPDGKNYKTCNDYRTNNSPPLHYRQNPTNRNLPLHPLPPHRQAHRHHLHNQIFHLPP